MDFLKEELKKKLEFYRNVEEKIKAQLDSAPPGKLIISVCRKKYPQFYKSEESEIDNRWKKTYLSGKNQEEVKQLAQKDYNLKMLAELEKQSGLLEHFLEEFDPEFITAIYKSLIPKEQQVVAPIVVPDDIFIERWMSDYRGSANKYAFSSDIFTKREEPVRSKSEKNIADTLIDRKIPYKYEHPLYLKKSNRRYCPDFYCLNVRTRKIYIWEHLGKTDSEDYIADNTEKLSFYQKEGFYPGENLILTFESRDVPLNQKAIDHIIDRYLV